MSDPKPSVVILVESVEWIDGIKAALREASLDVVEIRGGKLPLLRAGGVDVSFGESAYSPGIAIALEDAKDRGAKWAFRLGTCGGYEKTMDVGNIVLCTGAIRGEGTSSCYVADRGFPASADFEATSLLARGLTAAGTSVYTGVLWTTDGRVAGQYDPARIAENEKNHVLGVEMESSAHFVVSQVLGLRAGNLAVVVDLPAHDESFKAIGGDRVEAIDHGLRSCMSAIAGAVAALATGHQSALPGPHVRHETQVP
jgi:hypothetical protein